MGLDHAIDSLSDDYMRNMYKARYSVINVTGLVAKDYIKEAKQVCTEMMNSNLDDYYTSLIALQRKYIHARRSKQRY